MRKNDWFGLGASILVHLLLLLAFSFMTVVASEEQPIGFIEVEFGPLAQGRPVQKAEATRPAPVEEPKRPRPEVEQQVASTPPEKVKPVDLPDQPEVADEEQVETPEAETIAPEKRNNPEPVKKTEPQPRPDPVQPLGGGARDGSSGAPEGDAGAAADERKTAPFQIEGLNRIPTVTALPAYVEKVNAVISVRITVDPQGRIVQRIPLIKGNPALEQAVMDALLRWRFNPLPPNAPQENQTGVITFRFRLE
ncbi:TonB family protein [Rhodocaloribacter litoris]|uniref:energy transducer TonB family protein n=1 Tax=Rhodocaloribacter litoris TaxID=2558931 RepID=UPI0014212AD4|nr:TonB family protein [Rhodocaloribacter litoris]QXD15270.1 TonB family protein [Rhodocaloribacter litoris]GIV62271.1 MAG: cell envelope biogenesis protein TonB [Rhodothermaceae bacterium]